MDNICWMHPFQPFQDLVNEILIVLLGKILTRLNNLVQISFHQALNEINFIKIICVIYIYIKKWSNLKKKEEEGVNCELQKSKNNTLSWELKCLNNFSSLRALLANIFSSKLRAPTFLIATSCPVSTFDAALWKSKRVCDGWATNRKFCKKKSYQTTP